MAQSPEKKTAPPTVANHRLEVLSLDDFLDQVMERVPRGTLDLRDDAKRQQFREWWRAELGLLLRDLQDAATKGAERGIAQVMALARDPDYYATKRERHRREREERAADRQEWEARRAARQALDDQLRGLWGDE